MPYRKSVKHNLMCFFDSFVEATICEEVNSKSMSTVETYNRYLTSYSNTMQMIPDAPPPFPIDEHKIRGFLHYKINVSEKPIQYSTFKLFISSFSYYFISNKQLDVTKNEDFLNYVKSVQRKLGTSNKMSKKPIPPEYMIKISEIIEKNNFEDVKFYTAISLSYYGFLRYSEVSSLQMKNIFIEENGISIEILKSKNDPMGSGTMCYIARNDKPHNPYKWCCLLFSMKKFNCDDYLFNYNNRSFTRKLRYLLLKIGINDTTKFSSHSLRKGGANAAAKKGIQDNVIQRHGRWKSTVFMKYTKLERKEAGIMISEII